MKKIYSLLFAFTALFFAASCTPEVDDAFDQSSAERITASISETQRVLTAAPNGWLMNYQGADQYGGYNILLKFDSTDNVVIRDEVGNLDNTSHYTVKQSQGVLLSFDTYNESLHRYSDPVGRLNNSSVGTNGQGFQGDFEFRVLTANADSVVLQGRKNNARIVMTPLPDTVQWSQYISDVRYMESLVNDPEFYYMHIGTDSFRVTRSYNTLQAVGSNGTTVQMPFINTTTGVKLMRPIQFEGRTLTGFRYSEDNKWKNLNDTTVVLSPYYPSVAEYFLSNTWTINTTNSASEYVDVWKSFAALFKKRLPIRLLTFGTYAQTGGFGLGAYVVSGSGVTSGLLALDVQQVDDNTVTFNAYNADNSSEIGRILYNTYRYSIILGTIIPNNQPATYTLTANDPRHPTTITLTNILNPNARIVVNLGLSTRYFNLYD